MSQPIPTPLDNPSNTDFFSCPPLTWGILGCGHVANDFVIALTRNIKSAKVVACASNSGGTASASTFASTHKIPRSYGSYQELLDSEVEVQVVYISTVQGYRRVGDGVCEAALKAGKHVLIEKPFSCDAKDAEYLVALAKEKGLFCLEGMWTRFFPAVETARRLVLEEGLIGDVTSIFSDFSIDASDNDGEVYPDSFLYNHRMGGGSLYNIGPYPIVYALLFLGGAKRAPDVVKAVGQVDDLAGVDLQTSILLSFPPAKNETKSDTERDKKKSRKVPSISGAGVASLHVGLLSESPEETIIVGTKGCLKICSPSHCPTKLIIEVKAKGRSQKGHHLEYIYPHPIDEEKESGDERAYLMPGSAGFAYEAAAVARCIASGKTETPQFTLEETIITANVIEELRTQLGVESIGSR